MDELLLKETENLSLSWIKIKKEVVKEYLVTGFQNPRINMSSIITRHYFINEIFGDRFKDLMEEEIEFILKIHKALKEEEKRMETAASDEERKYPRYLRQKNLEKVVSADTWDIYMNKWSKVLKPFKNKSIEKIKVLELACGSANDYRFFYQYGIADFLIYTGIDLTEANIDNAKKMFPDIDFRVGNALEINAEDKEYNYVLVSDLFEHLSLHGLETAAKEVCRVTASKLIINFFSMGDAVDHKVNPIRNYHWNLLSCSKTKQLFENWCKVTDIIWIKEFQKKTFGYSEYYNQHSHTFFLEK